MEAVQSVILPFQDAQLGLVKLTAKLDGENKAEAAACLEGFRLSEKLLRERLFVLQVIAISN